MRVITLLCFVTLSGLLTMSNILPVSPPNALDRCPVPRSVSIQHVTLNSAEITWSSSDSALATDLQWRTVGDPDWQTLPAVISPYVLEDLTPCVSYEIRLQAFCDGSESEVTGTFTLTADGCCRIPSGLAVVAAGETEVVIGWDLVSFAFAHHVRYRALGDEEWIAEKVDTNFITFDSLLSCTLYEVQVGSQCDLDSTEFSESLVFQTIACGTCTEQVYCSAYGDDARSEWIDSVSFGSLRLRSGSNDGYLLLNVPQTGIERKRPYQFHVTPAATFPGAQFYLRMWIDLNQDGVFTDSTELLVDPEDPITVQGWNQTIVIPDSIPLGNTRMRIALKSVIDGDTLRPEACGTFLFGEVEDYCLSIDDVCPEAQISTGFITETQAVLFWNPIPEVLAYVYRYRDVDEPGFMDPEVTTDTTVTLSGLQRCKTYEFQILGVCIQDTSSLVTFTFDTECPNATIGPLPVAQDVIAYPVPFSDHLTIQLHALVPGRAIVRLFNITGHEVRRMTIALEQDATQQIRMQGLGELPHGMYLLFLESGDRRQVLKVVK